MELAYASLLTALWALASYLWLRQQAPKPTHEVLPANTASDFLLVYASQGGTAKAIAEGLQAQFTARSDGQPQLLPLEALDLAQLSQAKYALFVVSTFGDGAAPDHAQQFVRRCMGNTQSDTLGRLQFAVLALGDRQYRDFCAFGHQLAGWLRQQGANALWPLVEVNREDPSALARWQQALAQHFAVQPSVAPQTTACRLIDRRLLNPGSRNPQLYLLRFALAQPAPTQPPSGPALTAMPGDIAKILLPSYISPTVQWRSYSVANFDPQQRVIDLVIRQVKRPDGTPGIGSHWLTERVDGGSTVSIQLQKGVPLHRCAAHAPLIMIGAGSGLAGVRAALQYRQQQGVKGDWLITGERDPNYDLPLWDEWQQAQRQGYLAYWDACFSQPSEAVECNGQSLCYVQDALVANAERLRQFLIQGASIYICGSADGLGASVDQHLHNLLGSTVMEVLQNQQRYLRDLY